MVIRIGVAVALVGLLLVAGCRRAEPEADPIVPVGEEGAQALQMGDVTVVDNRGETRLDPFGEPPDPATVWTDLGVIPAGGEVTASTDRFCRIEDRSVSASALVTTFTEQLRGHGWTQQTGNDPLRVGMTRDGLTLSLVGNELATGGAGVGFSLSQDWALLGLPPEGANMAASGPTDCHATWMEGRTTPEVMAQVEQQLAAAGWTHAVEELVATREGIRDVASRGYVQGARTLRIQVHSQDDGTVQLRVDAGWRRVAPAGGTAAESP